MNKVLRTIRSEKQWPGIKGFIVEIEMNVPKKEPVKAEIFMDAEWLKIHMFIQGMVESDKMAEVQADTLLNLIESYSEEKYSQGYDEGESQAADKAGADY